MKVLADAILELLYAAGDVFVPVRQVAEQTSADASSIERAAQELRRRGQTIEQSPLHGLRLARPAALDAGLIERGLGTARVGRGVLCFQEVDSTNDVAFGAARGGDSDGLVVLADSQRRGRGTMGRTWLSPPKSSLLMSVLLQDRPRGRHGCVVPSRAGDADETHPRAAAPLPASEALTIAAGVAAAQAVKDCCGVEAGLKWPNDVIVDGRKLAGVLVERRNVAGDCAVVGIGLNVAAAPGDDVVEAPATCLADHCPATVEWIELARALLRRLDEWVARLGENRLDELHDRFSERCVLLGERVTVISAAQTYTGRCLDVAPLTGMVLACDDGRHVHLPAAVSSVAKQPH